MLAHALGVPVFHPVIEFLVVAEIKALLLQLPFEVPVGFGDEPELIVLRFDRCDHRRPSSRWLAWSLHVRPMCARRCCSA